MNVMEITITASQKENKGCRKNICYEKQFEDTITRKHTSLTLEKAHHQILQSQPPMHELHSSFLKSFQIQCMSLGLENLIWITK